MLQQNFASGVQPTTGVDKLVHRSHYEIPQGQDETHLTEEGGPKQILIPVIMKEKNRTLIFPHLTLTEPANTDMLAPPLVHQRKRFAGC